MHTHHCTKCNGVGLQSNIHLPQLLLGSWVVMNIVNGIASMCTRGGSPCALIPPSLAPEEQMLWGAPVNVACAERNKI